MILYYKVISSLKLMFEALKFQYFILLFQHLPREGSRLHCKKLIKYGSVQLYFLTYF